jgi:transcriptional regulator with XRE-family HTH domain
MDIENTSIRLKKLMKDRKLRQVDLLEMVKPFCEKYDVKMNKSDISQYLSGIVKPGQEKLSMLGMALNVNEAWLMGYDVPIERMQHPKSLELSNDEFELLSNYKKLNSSGKERLIEYSNDLIETPKYIKENDNVTDLITATKKESQPLENIYTTLAAHDDNLMNDEKQNADMKIMEALKKRQK